MGTDVATIPASLAYPVLVDLVDRYDRMGYSTIQIMHELLSDPTTAVVFNEVMGRHDFNAETREIKMLAQIKGIQKNLAYQRRTEVTPESIAEALSEYVAREDRIFQEAWRDHQDAPDYQTKLRALEVAQSSARNKAKALGVGMEQSTKVLKRTARIPVNSPDEILGLANEVHQQLKQSNARYIELTEERNFDTYDNGDGDSTDMA
jgi:hypothetical protein